MNIVIYEGGVKISYSDVMRVYYTNVQQKFLNIKNKERKKRKKKKQNEEISIFLKAKSLWMI